jgi:hypothetical protein
MKRKITQLFGLISCLVMITVLLPTLVSAELLTNAVTHKTYLRSDIIAFQTNIVEPLIMQVVRGELPLEGLNARSREQTKEIRARYGRGVNLYYFQELPQSSSVLASVMQSRVDNGVPKVFVFMPNIVANFEINGSTNFETRMQEHRADIVLGFMHELDHLCLGDVPGWNASTNATDAEALLECEKRAWALTCDKTIRVFVEHGYPVIKTRRTFYDAWIESGCDAKSPIWDKAIRRLYKPVYDKVVEERAKG